MRIVHICPRYYPDIGGVETVVQEVCERLVKLGHKIDVITTDPSGKLPKTEIINGVNIIRFRAFAPGDAYFFAPQIYFYLKKQKYDVVHIHSYHALPALFGALDQCDSKLVFSTYYHGVGHTSFRDMLLKPYKLLGKYAIEKADNIICMTQHEKKVLERDFGEMNKIKIIPSGVNLTELKSVSYDPTPHSLLYVGRLEEYKGIQYIIRALRNMPDYRLTIVGRGSYGRDLHEIARACGVDNQILWIDYASREMLLNLYAKSEIFVMLSDKESYGITVAEALAIGVPCIVNGTSALCEFTNNMICTALYGDFETSLPGAIVLLRLLTQLNTPELTKEDTAAIWSWDKVVAEIVKTYGVVWT